MDKQNLNLKNTIKQKCFLLLQKPFFQCLLLSFLLNFFLETTNRRSILAGLRFLMHSPFLFSYNALIIMLTLSVALFFKRKNFIFLTISLLWISLGIVNFVLLGFRTTPLAAIDFLIIKPDMSIMMIYLTSLQLIFIILILILAIAGLILAWKTTKTHHPSFTKALLLVAITATTVFGFTSLSVQTHALSTSFENMPDAYNAYGFAYCFSASLIDRGIKEPDGYSEEFIQTLKNQYKLQSPSSKAIHSQATTPSTSTASATPLPSDAASKATLQQPNIIMVQLESFIDLNQLNHVTFSQDPSPFFTQLKQNYSSGYLKVPTIGAGTANTEFEILTGMSLTSFGAGEYPYKTILQKSTSESIAFNLKSLNYQTRAIHNHTGSFYDRNLVFQNLGFEGFTSIEYMKNLEYTPLGWAKDKVLTQEILDTLDSTANQDFIYAISVQAHGKYPSDYLFPDQKIFATGLSNVSQTKSLEYFAQQIYETDLFVQNLVQTLKQRQEPTVVVFYGDHFPALSIEPQNLKNPNLFETEYVIWSNFDLPKQDYSVTAYQLTAYLFSRLGLKTGILDQFHQQYIKDIAKTSHLASSIPPISIPENSLLTVDDDFFKPLSVSETYLSYLEFLQYDMLYGEKFIFNQIQPYPTDTITMGLKPIELYSVHRDDSSSTPDLILKGNNFTSYSTVFVNQKKQLTLFQDAHTLQVSNLAIENGDTVFIAQVSEEGKILSQTKSYIESGTPNTSLS